LQKYKWLMMAFLIVAIVTLTGGAILGENDPSLKEFPTHKDVNDVNEIFQPEIFLQADANIAYGLSRKAGFLFSNDAGKTWSLRNDGLPKKKIYPYKEEQVRHLVSLGVDPKNSSRVAVLTASQIYISENYGQKWELVARKRPIPEGAYLTAIALSPVDKDTILLGTSFAGIFETHDRGQNWRNISKELKFLYQGADYWDEISALAYPKTDPERILFRAGFGQAIYRMSPDHKNAEKVIELTTNNPFVTPNDTAKPFQNDTGNKSNQDISKDTILKNSADLNPISNPSTDDSDLLFDNPLKHRPVEMDPAKKARLHMATGRIGIYLRSDKASGQSLDQKIQFLKSNGLNSLVVDCKDDFGFITYDTKLAQPRQMGAVRRNGIRMGELLKRAKQNGIYVIGRIVTFQDPKLFEYQNFKYAVWDKTTDKPWNTREYWVDPYSEGVWEYNRAIAEELQSLGVDEIQFDYIRFPTDGDISKIAFRYRPTGAEKADAIESFLVYVRQKITIPISTDLYGFSCWCRSISSNGQNLEEISDYVDVICPMFYPSHFPSNFLPQFDYLERARRIYQDGTNRAYAITGGRSMVRPYVQAFRLGKELKMTPPVYTDYLLRQIQGNLATLSPGFTLWDYSNSYYMVTKPVGSFLNQKVAGENK
jgi:hypothetical protein